MKLRLGSVRTALIVCVALSTLLAAHAGHAATSLTFNDGWPYAPGTDASNIFLSYAVTPTSGTAFSSNIYDILTFNQYASGGTGVWWPATVGASGGTITDPFAKSTTNMPLSGLIVGLVNESSGDPGLVLMVNNSFAAGNIGQSFGTLFPSQTEDTLISDIEFTMGNNRADLNPSQQAVWDADLNAIWSTFAAGDALSANAWFNLGYLPYPSAYGTVVTSDFTVMEWSGGQGIGTGVASLTYAPLPSAMLLLGSGIAGLAGFRKRFIGK